MIDQFFFAFDTLRHATKNYQKVDKAIPKLQQHINWHKNSSFFQLSKLEIFVFIQSNLSKKIVEQNAKGVTKFLPEISSKTSKTGMIAQEGVKRLTKDFN